MDLCNLGRRLQWCRGRTWECWWRICCEGKLSRRRAPSQPCGRTVSSSSLSCTTFWVWNKCIPGCGEAGRSKKKFLRLWSPGCCKCVSRYCWTFPWRRPIPPLVSVGRSHALWSFPVHSSRRPLFLDIWWNEWPSEWPSEWHPGDQQFPTPAEFWRHQFSRRCPEDWLEQSTIH